MKKKTAKIIRDSKISVETTSKFINDFVDDLIKKVFNTNGGGIPKIREHIKNHNAKIIPCFVKWVQLHLDTNGKVANKAAIARIEASHKLFKNGFNEIMEHTKFGFYQFIYEAWRHLLINLCEEVIKDSNEKISSLFLTLFWEVNAAYGLADKENKKQFKHKD